MSSLHRILKLAGLAGAALALAGCCVLPFGHGRGHARGYYSSAEPHRYDSAPPGPPMGQGQVPYRRGPMVH